MNKKLQVILASMLALALALGAASAASAQDKCPVESGTLSQGGTVFWNNGGVCLVSYDNGTNWEPYFKVSEASSAVTDGGQPGWLTKLFTNLGYGGLLGIGAVAGILTLVLAKTKQIFWLFVLPQVAFVFFAIIVLPVHAMGYVWAYIGGWLTGFFGTWMFGLQGL